MIERVALLDLVARGRRLLLRALEIGSISALILLTRCANYHDVFVGKNVYFVDADCYARMTRARICFQHPGTIVRNHQFENFPQGTSPHTTAPFDYLIVATAALLRPFTANALDLAGAIISPLIALCLGVFLCWWSRRMALPFRFAALALYAMSPILTHGMALGRPDHQSLVIALAAVAICSEWTLQIRASLGWNVTAGICWAAAIWVSLYEPAILLVLVSASAWLTPRLFAKASRGQFRQKDKKTVSWASTTEQVKGSLQSQLAMSGARDRPHLERWVAFSIVLVVAMAIEQRIPTVTSRGFAGPLANWSSSIGELAHVSLTDGVWFEWCGWLLLLAPILFWPSKPRYAPGFLIVALTATFALTIWQVRWSYFFALFFAMSLPEVLIRLRNRWVAAIAFVIGIFPLAQAWDRTFSPQEISRRAETTREMQELRAIASQIDGPFLAPWWLSPALAYWSGAPGLAGSSHEAISGILDSARFYTAGDPTTAQIMCEQRHVQWVVCYDADRVAANAAHILGQSTSPDALCYVLDRTPSRAPGFLQLISQTGRFKLFRVTHSS